MMGRLFKLYLEFTLARDLKLVHMMGNGEKMDTFTFEIMVCANLMAFYHIFADQDEVVYIHSFHACMYVWLCIVMYICIVMYVWLYVCVLHVCV